MIPIFILTYCGINEHKKLIDRNLFPDCQFILVDNGGQELFEDYFRASTNIGCAGGWNLICDIAFNLLGYEKIIISQDDAFFTFDTVEQLHSECTPKNLVGAYQPFFEFSCFSIHRDTWNRVGRFDENCIYVYSEDVDYKQRCRLNNITVSSLHIPVHGNNQSLTVQRAPSLNKIKSNRDYIRFKWGASIHPSPLARQDGQAPFENITPFRSEGQFSLDFIPFTTRITKIYSGYSDFPSKIEFLRIMQQERI